MDIIEKNILQVKEPRISCYTSIGTLFAILPDELNTWVYNSFIQLIYAKNWEIYTFENHRFLHSDCPGIDYNIFPQYIIKKLCLSSFFNMIKEIVDEGEYIYLYIDRYYLSIDKRNYLRHHYPHELLIYGYDINTGEINIADNLQNGKFIFTKCSIEDIEKGFFLLETTYSFMKSIRTFKVKKNIKYSLNIEQIIHGLQSFLYSKPTYYLNKEQEMIFGLDIFDFLLCQIDESVNNNYILVDTRAFHLIYEQIFIMQERIIYLFSMKLIINQNKLNDYMKIMRQDALNLRNLALKFNISKSINTIQNIKIKLLKLRDNIVVAYNLLLDSFC